MNQSGTFFTYKSELDKTYEKISFIQESIIPTITNSVNLLAGKDSVSGLKADIQSLGSIGAAGYSLILDYSVPSLKVPDAPDAAVKADTEFLNGKLGEIENCIFKKCEINPKEGVISIVLNIRDIR